MLFRSDLPQPLEDAGGWLVRDTAEAFAAYGAVVHERLGDRVGLWASHNEPWCAAYLGYAAGVHAPGRREGGEAHLAAHHLMVGHGLLRQALGEVEGLGIVLNLAPVWPEPGAERVGDAVDAIRNRVWLDPLVDGAYDERLLEAAPVLADPARVRDDDLAMIRGSADWLGINYYTPVRPALPDAVADDHPEGAAYPGAGEVAFAVREPRTDIGWEIDASGLEELLLTTHERTGLPIVVTENGAACADAAVVDGVVEDEDRIDYLRDHLAATERAREQGADVRGYFVWTLMDNFEWAEGYTKTFGLVHVDRSHADLPRTPKASYHWVAAEARRRDASFRST